ncbi:hypothetical protein SCUCBS95973_002901 [Sporothrix curviconia]|uniref:Purine-cytosine permease n=1 Tax=Sporothrix curviconia TaxID=1260050 RepID=A0ABP0BAU6_9PEZI
MAASIHGSDPSTDAVVADVEKGVDNAKGTKIASEVHPVTDVEVIEGESRLLKSAPLDRLWSFLSSSGVELRGVQPVPEELRTDSAFNKIFTVWCTSLLCPLPIVTGMLGTLTLGMSLRDTSLLILFFSLLMCVPPAFIETISPQTGMRQMIQSRYCFGMYPNILVAVLNMCTLCGYSIICLVTAGQTLSAVSGGHINATVGIVIVAVCAMLPAFGGFQIIHHYERWAWIPALIAIVITVGVGGSKLHEQAPVADPVAAPTVITFISFIAGYMLPYSTTIGDIAVYMGPRPPRLRIFLYAWLGICLPSILLMILGAAIGGAVPNIAAWSAANDADAVGGILVAMLAPAGGFGKFVAVLLALSVVAQISPGFYSVSLNFQIIWPHFARVPRVFFVLAITAIDIGVGIAAAESFFDALENFLGIISYWSAAFTGILLTEWFVFRKGKASALDPAIWNDSRRLPTGLAALAALLVPFGLVVPSMDQVWYTGPIAEVTGDLGFEFATVLGILIYVPLRSLEIRLGRL